MPYRHRKTPLICLCGKSGTGKDTLARLTGLTTVVSHTTRPMREGETDGVDYHFHEKGWFTPSVRDRNFNLDCKEIYGNIYGASDEDIATCDIMVILLRDAVHLRKQGVPVWIVWLEGPVYSPRAGRDSATEMEEMFRENLEEINEFLSNKGTPEEGADALKQLVMSVRELYEKYPHIRSKCFGFMEEE